MQNDESVSPVRQFFRHKWVRLILALDVVAIVAVVGILIWNATKTATINFSVAPIDASIQIGGLGGGILMVLIKSILAPTTLPLATTG